MLFDVLTGNIQRDGRVIAAACVKGNIFQQIFHYRMQPSCTDILGSKVELHGNLGNTLDCALVELQIDIIHTQKLAVLEGEGIFRFRQNTHEILFGKAV